MSGDPPDDNGILPWDWTWSGVGHGVLDIAGLVPGFGEAADLANAAWYVGEEKYLDAGLSIISMVPVVGDALGKGGRLLKAGAGKLSGPALKALKNMDFKKILDALPSHSKIDPVKDKILEALEKWRKDLLGEAPTTPCKTGCPDGKKSGSVRKKSNRETVLGRTPSKTSRTGKEVRERMRKEGNLREDPFTGKDEFFDDRTKKWYPVDSKDTHMGHHPKDAVDYWNETGKLHGPKSKEVRDWMLDSDNYRFEYGPANSAAGGATKSRYDMTGIGD